MKEKKTKKISFFADVVEKGMPFVRVSEGILKGCILMVDTGSTCNSLFGKAYNELRDSFHSIEGTSSIFGIDGKEFDAKYVEGVVEICGKMYQMVFLINDSGNASEKLYENLGFHVSGIIGSKFMAEHNWMIDFGKQEIVIPKGDISLSDLNSIKHKACTIA